MVKFFGWLDFENLLTVSEKNDRFKYLIRAHFIRDKFKLHERTICIANDPNNYYYTDDFCFLINSRETTLTFLRNFGDQVAKLNVIGNGVTDNQINLISHYIHEYCAQSLTELTLEQIKENPIVRWTKIFPKLESLYFQKTKETKQLQIHTIFPNLKRFEIERDQRSSFAFLGYNFPHLEHFKMDAGLLSENPHVKSALLLNPQLKSFHTDSRFDMKFIHFINKHLPNLLSLGIEYTSFGDSEVDETVQFEHVKDFTFNIYHMPPNKIFILKLFGFKQLDTLDLNCRILNEELVKFIKQQDRLKTMKLVGANAGYDALVDLIQALPELREIHLPWVNPKDSGGVVGILTNETPIEILSLELSSQNRGSLMAILPDNWRLVNDERTRFDHYLTFEREKGEVLEASGFFHGI